LEIFPVLIVIDPGGERERERERERGVITTFLVWDLFCLLWGVGIPAGFYSLSSGVVLLAVSSSRRDFYRLAL
jgi:hypothetical protein